MKTIKMISVAIGILMSQAFFANAGYFNSTPLPRCEVQITSQLSRGSENNDVLILQNVLVRSGFLHASPNGYFGYQTEAAVRYFQSVNGISATGVVGPLTRNAINERLCDIDVVGVGGSYENVYADGVTYVSPEDPFVQVITPQPSSEAFVYTTPQEKTSFLSSVTGTVSSAVNSLFTPQTQNISPIVTSQNVLNPATVTVSPNSSAINPIHSTQVIYAPSVGYTYGITPESASVTVTSPLPNTTFKEGDTVNVRWYTSNLKSTTFTISIENNVSRQSKVIGMTSGNSYTFTLSSDILNDICSGVCTNNQTGSFKIVLSTQAVDIAGNTSTLKASVAQVTITRTPILSGVSITTSKTPVNSGDGFKLYTNIPRGASWDAYLTGNYSIRVRAVCPSSTSVSIAGVSCGNDFVIPFAPSYFQQEIPTSIINTSWFRQTVVFELTVTNLSGDIIGTNSVNVIVNGTPFSW
jgi:peptidoglycan hydrolase-like protein with peptidoglycan-binding domain